MENQNRKLIIVGQEAGGVGKTVTALHLADLYAKRGTNLVVLDADDKNRTADGSALAHSLPGHQVIWLGTGPSIEQMQTDQDAGHAHWDKVRAMLDHESVLLDLGANVFQRLTEYALRMRAARRWAEDGISVEVFVPVVSEKIALEAGLKALGAAGKAFGPAALRCVMNRRDGDFNAWDGTPQGKALAALARSGVRLVDLPKAPIPPEGLLAMRRGPWSAAQVVDMGWRDAAEKLGLPKPVAERTFYGCEDWMAAIESAWSPVLPSLPQGEPVARAS